MTGAALPEVFGVLLAELESHRLEVALVPAPRPRHECHAVRVAVSRNPTWYRRLCAWFPSSRRRAKSLPDTRVRRANIVSILSQLAEGRPVRSQYAQPLARIASTLPALGVAPAIPPQPVTSSPAGEQLSEGLPPWL